MKNFFLSGIRNFLALLLFTFIAGAVYAAVTWPMDRELGGPNKVVTSTLMQGIIDNLNDLNTRVNATASVPTGAVMAFFGSSCPIGWSPADGTPNGVKKTDGTVGTLDLRGEFVRGWDPTETIDATGRQVSKINTTANSGVGSWQMEMIGPHAHPTNFLLNIATAGNGRSIPWFSSPGYTNLLTNDVVLQNSGSENRPRNVALLYCVKQ